MTSANWREFRFSNPDTPFKRNYNWLCTTMRPQIAISYAVMACPGGSANAMEFKHSIDASLGGNVGNLLINAFQEPSDNDQQKWLGLMVGWKPPKIAIERDGKTFLLETNGTGGGELSKQEGNTFQFPEVDTAWVRVKGWAEK